MTTVSQIPLDLGHQASFEISDFIVSTSNEAAFTLVQSWPDWPSHVVALVGPQASGKTHLARAWAKEVSATVFEAGQPISDLEPERPVLLEDVDTGAVSDEEFFHLFNWSKEIGANLLVTAKNAPTKWEIELPDLRSRVATITVGEISQPDDNLIMALLIKLFSDRQLQVDLSVVNYVLPRIERSFRAVYEFVTRLDAEALAGQRKISRALAKSCLDPHQDGQL